MTELRLMGAVHVAPDLDQLFDDMGYALMAAATEAVKQRGAFHLALSGGSTPEPFYMRLITDLPFRQLPWKQTHVWIVDERRVPVDDQRSNYRMIQESLTDHVPTPRRYIHPIRMNAEDPAAEYEQQLRQTFAEASDDPARLDYVLLGMGDDAHTASLFPGSPAQLEIQKWVALNQGPSVTPPDRVTMTYPLLNAARQIAVLVTGSKKNQMLLQIDQCLQEGGPDPQKLPITGIDPSSAGGELTWYLDNEAAGTAESDQS